MVRNNSNASPPPPHHLLQQQQLSTSPPKSSPLQIAASASMTSLTPTASSSTTTTISNSTATTTAAAVMIVCQSCSKQVPASSAVDVRVLNQDVKYCQTCTSEHDSRTSVVLSSVLDTVSVQLNEDKHAYHHLF